MLHAVNYSLTTIRKIPNFDCSGLVRYPPHHPIVRGPSLSQLDFDRWDEARANQWRQTQKGDSFLVVLSLKLKENTLLPGTEA